MLNPMQILGFAPWENLRASATTTSARAIPARPRHLAPAPTNIRCYSNTGQTRARLDVRFVPILLQKSKIDGWQFSREKAK